MKLINHDSAFFHFVLKHCCMKKLVTVAGLSISLCLSFFNSFSQASPEVATEINKMIPKVQQLSPNVAGLGKYGDYQVSLYTGLPEISIPIFEAKSGSVSVPITLSYHASGIKYGEKSSWVGLGWSLLAGGSVVRQVRGKIDEEFYYSNPIPQGVDPCTDYEYIKDLVNGVKDAEPDQFAYTYPGKSGKFFLTQGATGVAREYLLIPYEPIKIKDDDYTLGTNWFEIKDESGTIYRYGQNELNELAQETTVDGNNAVVSNAWHLMKISAANSDDNIQISYQEVGQSTTDDISYTLTVNDACLAEQGDPTGQENCPLTNTNGLSSKNVSTFVIQKAPKEIFFEGGKVVFTLGTETNDQAGFKSLSEISVFAKVGEGYELRKKIKFNYGYFRNAGNTADLRLKLNSVQITDDTGVKIQEYKFDYHTDYFSWNTNISSSARDVWGYYNGATSNTNLIPSTEIEVQLAPSAYQTLQIGGAFNRNANLSYTREGVIKRVTFPTGGYSEFEFELHKYYEDNTVKDAGGLRVSRITSNDGSGSNSQVKTYKYGLNESGYGEKNFDNSLFYYRSQMLVRHLYAGNTGGNHRYRSQTFFSTPAAGLDAAEGSSVVYPYVTEYNGVKGQEGEPDNYIGRTVYVFDKGLYTPDVMQGTPNSAKKFRNSLSWKRGKLTKKSVYTLTGTVPISETEIEYGTYHGQSPQVGWGGGKGILYSNVYVDPIQPCTISGNVIDAQEYGVLGPYAQSTGAVREVSRKETTFDVNSTTRFISLFKTLTWDQQYLQVNESTESTSQNSDLIVTKTKYPFSYTYTGNETGTAGVLRLMKERNMINVPIENYTLKQNIGVIGGQVTSFKENPANTSYLIPEKIYVLEASKPVTESSSFTLISDNALTVDPLFIPRITPTYNAYGDIIQIDKLNGSNQGSDISMGYLYGYGNTLPIAKATNANNTEMYVQNFEDETLSGQSISPSSSHTGIKYWAGGNYQVNFIRPNNRPYVIDYWYSSGGQWYYIKKDYTSNSVTLTESTTFDDIRIYPKDAQMTTYTYDHVLGMTSTEDMNGRTTYYEYDDFGQLIVTRDSEKNIVKAYKYRYNSQE